MVIVALILDADARGVDLMVPVNRVRSVLAYVFVGDRFHPRFFVLFDYMTNSAFASFNQKHHKSLVQSTHTAHSTPRCLPPPAPPSSHTLSPATTVQRGLGGCISCSRCVYRDRRWPSCAAFLASFAAVHRAAGMGFLWTSPPPHVFARPPLYCRLAPFCRVMWPLMVLFLTVQVVFASFLAALAR